MVTLLAGIDLLQRAKLNPLRVVWQRKTCYLKSRGKPEIFDRNLEK